MWDDRFRVLHNVTGLWLLSETCARGRAKTARPSTCQGFSTRRPPQRRPPPCSTRTTPRCRPPGTCRRVSLASCTHTVPSRPPIVPAFVRLVVESIAAAFADAVRTAGRLSGQSLDVVHLVGGGSLNRLLCQATADRTGLPVLAGPVEATALGNVLVQARALGAAPAELSELRALVAATHPPAAYRPRSS
ncbi:FGGY-family carbohydrate kinase [Microbacterium sp. NRRL B-14842]|uniref:FGGY-family carbohydrate kinase n=1 Tax=Microbacterium sp. NRRL B-14842 TaxID=3162881 RepID=UPI003D2DF8BD